MLDFSTLVSKPNIEPTFSNQPTKNLCPIIILTIKFEGMEIMLLNLCKRDVKDKFVDKCRLLGYIVVGLMDGFGII